MYKSVGECASIRNQQKTVSFSVPLDECFFTCSMKSRNESQRDMYVERLLSRMISIIISIVIRSFSFFCFYFPFFLLFNSNRAALAFERFAFQRISL